MASKTTREYCLQWLFAPSTLTRTCQTDRVKSNSLLNDNAMGSRGTQEAKCFFALKLGNRCRRTRSNVGRACSPSIHIQSGWSHIGQFNSGPASSPGHAPLYLLANSKQDCISSCVQRRLAEQRDGVSFRPRTVAVSRTGSWLAFAPLIHTHSPTVQSPTRKATHTDPFWTMASSGTVPRVWPLFASPVSRLLC